MAKEMNVEECKVLFYINRIKRLAIDFKGYGISFDDVPRPAGNTVFVETKGTIGKKDFVANLVEFQ